MINSSETNNLSTLPHKVTKSVFALLTLLTVPIQPDRVAENQLLQRVRRLEEAALVEVHAHYFQPLFRYIRFRVHDHATAEDLTSEVFTRFLQAVQNKNAPQDTLRGWLFGTASYVLKDYYRAKKRDQEQNITLSDTLAGRLQSDDGSVGSALALQALEETLAEALTELTDEQQEVLGFRFGYGMSIREVAITMGKSEAAVKMLQARAVQALARLLSDTAVTTRGGSA